MRRSEIALVRHAAKQRWPISQALRAELVKELRKALTEGDDLRTKVAAAKALLVADGLNLREEEREAEAELRRRLDELEALIRAGGAALPPGAPGG